MSPCSAISRDTTSVWDSITRKSTSQAHHTHTHTHTWTARIEWIPNMTPFCPTKSTNTTLQYNCVSCYESSNHNTHSTNSQCSTILLSNIIHNMWLQYTVNPWKTTQQWHNTHTHTHVHTHTVSTTEQKQVRHQTTPHIFFQQNDGVLPTTTLLEQSLKDSIEYTLHKPASVFYQEHSTPSDKYWYSSTTNDERKCTTKMFISSDASQQRNTTLSINAVYQKSGLHQNWLAKLIPHLAHWNTHLAQSQLFAEWRSKWQRVHHHLWYGATPSVPPQHHCHSNLRMYTRDSQVYG